jgi:hypothetical protein
MRARRVWWSTPRGVEQTADFPKNLRLCRNGGAKSGAVGNKNGIDADLLQVITVWRTLPQPLRRPILAIIALSRE